MKDKPVQYTIRGVPGPVDQTLRHQARARRALPHFLNFLECDYVDA